MIRFKFIIEPNVFPSIPGPGDDIKTKEVLFDWTPKAASRLKENWRGQVHSAFVQFLNEIEPLVIKAIDSEK